MGSIYLIAGRAFQNRKDLSDLNKKLQTNNLIADSVPEEENCDQWTPKNIRRISDKKGISRFDFIRIKYEDFYDQIIVGEILDEADACPGIIHEYYPAGSSMKKILEAENLLKKDFPNIFVYAVFAYKNNVGRKNALLKA